MKKPETKFKERVWDDLKTLKGSYFRKIQNRTVRGLPDFFGCIRGHFIALELKKSGNERLEPLQQWNIEEILGAGGLAMPAYPENWKEVFEVLRQVSTGDVKIKGVGSTPRSMDS